MKAIRPLLRLGTVLALALAGPLAAKANAKPLKVFLLVGQSNMQGHAHVRTLDHVGMDEKTAPLLADIRAADGTAKVHEDVCISYLSAGGVRQGKLTTGFGADENKIGPELTFGIHLQRMLGEPILLIKAAWGGKSLHTDFRPPSAGPYRFTERQLDAVKRQGKDLAAVKKARREATGHYYRLMLEHTRKVLSNLGEVCPDYDAKAGHELAGFVWFQGWNDMVDSGVYPEREKPGGYDRYSETLAHFIRDVRRDLNAPNLPFFPGVMGAGGPVDQYLPGQRRYAGIHTNFRNAMAAPAKLPEFRGNVANVFTEKYWDPELTRLRGRENEIRQQVKKQRAADKLNRKQELALLEKLRNEKLNDREREILAKGVSNAEYHYLGSAKIMAQIGKGFAEAMRQLQGGKSAAEPPAATRR